VLHKRLLFLMRHFRQVHRCHFVLEVQLLNSGLESVLLLLQSFNCPLNNSSFVLELLVGCNEFVQVLL
jgi:hypothetical protein